MEEKKLPERGSRKKCKEEKEPKRCPGKVRGTTRARKGVRYHKIESKRNSGIGKKNEIKEVSGDGALYLDSAQAGI